MRKKVLFLAAGIVLLCVAAWAYYAYQKPHTDARDIAPSANVNAADLFNAYLSNETEADKKYTGKVISIKGTVNAVQKDSTTVNILLSAGDKAPGGINCSFYNAQSFKVPAINSPITIKGRCTGFLLDVNVVDCVIE
ncbi:OB-fold protein [Pinibacter soli]|uniref:tRNA_anti-like n=1 Tax=Pinibacter soli TaxID=3044211 RepID=A0ABT6RIN6_9BACT|nr:hypothetical protein [Pinibacter soli]MDI3322437.1 hypothetical protein [Pinibacter soli]